MQWPAPINVSRAEAGAASQHTYMHRHACMHARTRVSANNNKTKNQRVRPHTPRVVHVAEVDLRVDEPLRSCHLVIPTRLGEVHLAPLSCLIARSNVVLRDGKSRVCSDEKVTKRLLEINVNPFTVCVHAPQCEVCVGAAGVGTSCEPRHGICRVLLHELAFSVHATDGSERHREAVVATMLVQTDSACGRLLHSRPVCVHASKVVPKTRQVMRGQTKEAAMV
jgi:hypothetical protein